MVRRSRDSNLGLWIGVYYAYCEYTTKTLRHFLVFILIDNFTVKKDRKTLYRSHTSLNLSCSTCCTGFSRDWDDPDLSQIVKTGVFHLYVKNNTTLDSQIYETSLNTISFDFLITQNKIHQTVDISVKGFVTITPHLCIAVAKRPSGVLLRETLLTLWYSRLCK